MPDTTHNGAAEDGPRQYSASKPTACPHCGGPIEVTLTFAIATVAAGTPGPRGARTWEDHLTPEQHAVLDECRAAGVVGAFAQAVAHLPQQSRPADPARFLMTWLAKAGPRVVPPFAVAVLKARYPRQRLTFYAADGIVAVMGEGVLLGFVPMHLVIGRPVKGLAANRAIKGRLQAEPGPLEDWVRTRFGYVAGRGLLLEVLQQRSYGDFARPPL
jgi:hypothetical protein